MPLRRNLALCLCLLAGAALALPASADPARYIVFTLDAEGVPRPQSHRLVTLKDELPAKPADGRAKRGNGERLRVVLDDAAGVPVFEDLVEVPRFIRAEHGLFGGAAAGGQDELLAEGRSFVVRLPLLAGSRLRLQRADSADAAALAEPAEFDLDALAADPSLPLAGLAAGAELVPEAGSPANRVDILIMGDGYTAAEQGKFESDAAQMVNAFFGRSPYAQYRSYINTVTLFTPSAQSGADHPPYASFCAAAHFPSCCGDSAMQNDPLAGRFADTAFDGTFCSFNIHRLMVVDAAKVLTAAGGYASWDKILVLVNDSTYGGAGGDPVASLSTHAAVADLVQHEFGHSFTHLADEYSDAYPNFPDCSDISPGASRCESNVTDQTDRGRIKWSPLIASSTPIPTGGSDPTVVGLFEGARYLTSGMYRPQHTCLMGNLGSDFCKVCSQSFVLALYQGGWGSPAGGIDPIEPGSEAPRPGSVSLALPGSVTFSAGILQTSSSSVAASWKVDGTPAGSGRSFVFSPSRSGTYTVELEARDVTSLVHPGMPGVDALASQRRWTVNVTGQILHEPTVQAVSPDSGPTTGGAVVQIRGTRFTADARVKFGDRAATGVVVDSPTSITCTTPPGAAGPVGVTVTTEGGTATLPDAYTYGSVEECVPGAATLCLNQNRFKVEVAWRTAAPASGVGTATAIPGGTADSGLFWFFSSNNQEMLLKVLDGCAINGRYWVFYAATTNVDLTTVVTDTQTGRVKTYRNALGNPAPPVQDIEAFAGCPQP